MMAGAYGSHAAPLGLTSMLDPTANSSELTSSSSFSTCDTKRGHGYTIR